MIVVQLSGGLGNQMFQYAAGRALAARHGTEIVLDSSWIDGSGASVSTEVRRYELGCFPVSACLAPVEEVGKLHRSLLPNRRPLLRELAEPEYGRPCPELLGAGDLVAPRPWLQDARWDEGGRIPEGWIRIDRGSHQADQPPSTTTFAPVT